MEIMTTVVQMRKKGSITLPMKLRKKYQLDEDDPITLIDLGEGIFLSPRRAVLPKLAAQIQELRLKNDISLEELIEGVQNERKR